MGFSDISLSEVLTLKAGVSEDNLKHLIVLVLVLKWNSPFFTQDTMARNMCKTFSLVPSSRFEDALRASFCALRGKSCELSHMIYLKLTILIIVSSFPKLNDG